jgi:hypothetical protein
MEAKNILRYNEMLGVIKDLLESGSLEDKINFLLILEKEKNRTKEKKIFTLI